MDDGTTLAEGVVMGSGVTRRVCLSGELVAAPESTTTTSSTTTTTTTTIPMLTLDEALAAITPAAQAWIAAPSGDTFDALAAAAAGVIGDRELPQFPPSDPEGEGFWRMGLLTSYPGTDSLVYRQLDLLDIDGALPTFASGVYRVGDGPDQVPPGTYVAESGATTPFDGCYWETLDSTGDIIDNNFIGAGFRVVANVPASAFSVEFDDCGVFVRTG